MGYVIIAKWKGLSHFTFCHKEEDAYEIFKDRVGHLMYFCEEGLMSNEKLKAATDNWLYAVDDNNSVEIYPCREI